MADQPNILFIQVDQLTALALRAYGDEVCHSPAIDRLANEGVVYEQAYCNFPLCAPSRFSMATGQLCSVIGAYDNAAECPAEIPTYAHYLRAAGYQTALSGKMHFIGPDQYHGFEERLTSDLYPADFSWVPNWGQEGKRDTNDERAVKIAGICERTVQMDFDEEVTYKAVQHLYDLARSDDQRPFFLQVSYTHPHDPYLCQREFWDLYEGVELPSPRVGALSENEHDPHAIRLLKDFGMLGIEFSDEDIMRAIRGYYGSIAYVDHLIGKVLKALEATGFSENTAIIFTSDHGEMLGERGMWFKKHFFEKSMRIPLIIKTPEGASGRVETLASLVDLVPTFIEIAGGDAAVDTLEGTSLLSMMGANSDQDRMIFGEYLAESTLEPLYMIRRGAFKFITSEHDGDMLFDLSQDPVEMNNLAGHSDYGEIVAEFKAIADQKWDTETLSAKIIQSQQRRTLVRKAMKEGTPQSWHHEERPGDKTLWYRGNEGYNEWAFRRL